MSHAALLYCRGGCVSHATLLTSADGGIQVWTHITPSSTVMWLESYRHEQEGWWDAIQNSHHIILYCNVEDGVPHIPLSSEVQLVVCAPGLRKHPPQIQYAVERDLEIPTNKGSQYIEVSGKENHDTR